LARIAAAVAGGGTS